MRRLRQLFALFGAVSVFVHFLIYTKSKSNNADSFLTRHQDSPVPTGYYTIPNKTDLQLQRYVRRQVNETDPLSYQPFKDCSPTTQVYLIINNHSSQWILQAVDSNGNNKTVGGDEFYVEYRDENMVGFSNSTNHPTAVAVVKDKQNGTYTLDFFTPPSSNQETPNLTKGIITVNFVFTCHIGDAYQPTKDSWRTGGGTKVSHSTRVAFAPPVQIFQHPNQDGFVNLDTFDRIIAFGDSLLRQLIHNGTKFYDKRLNNIGNPNTDLSSKTVKRLYAIVKRYHRADLALSGTALLIGSSAWDILLQGHPQGRSFDDHIATCRRYVEAFRHSYPNCTVLWRLPTDLHFHNVNDKCLDSSTSNNTGYAGPWGGNIPCINVIRYMSSSRMSVLYEKQKALMKELAVPVVDAYAASVLSAHELRPGDSMHYNNVFNKRVLGWYGLQITQ